MQGVCSLFFSIEGEKIDLLSFFPFSLSLSEDNVRQKSRSASPSPLSPIFDEDPLFLPPSPFSHSLPFVQAGS